MIAWRDRFDSGWVDRYVRSAAVALLAQMRTGTAVIHEDGVAGELVLGVGPRSCSVVVHDQRFWAALMLRGSVGLGESYRDGWWSTDDLTEALAFALVAHAPLRHGLDAIGRTLAPLSRPFQSVGEHHLRRDRENIRAHYDLGNDFFELMLDDTMAYSSAWFGDGAETLFDAQTAKFEHLCRALDLRADDHLIEIGTGWGGFAIHAAQRYGCTVTTTTISRAQFEAARARVERAGLSDQVTVLEEDYRSMVSGPHAGRYDKLVSVEMIEAVPWRQVPLYFRSCEALLAPGGRMAIQAIVMNEASHDRAKRREDFIKRYIFPGGCLPSIGSMLEATARCDDLRPVSLVEFGFDYARTLRQWRSNLASRADDVTARGYGDPSFTRLWDFYLCYCEAAFRERHVSVVQMAFDRARTPGRVARPQVLDVRSLRTTS